MTIGASVLALGTGADHGGDTSNVTNTAPVNFTARSTSESVSAPMPVPLGGRSAFWDQTRSSMSAFGAKGHAAQKSLGISPRRKPAPRGTLFFCWPLSFCLLRELHPDLGHIE